MWKHERFYFLWWEYFVSHCAAKLLVCCIKIAVANAAHCKIKAVLSFTWHWAAHFAELLVSSNEKIKTLDLNIGRNKSKLQYWMRLTIIWLSWNIEFLYPTFIFKPQLTSQILDIEVYSIVYIIIKNKNMCIVFYYNH